MIVLCFKRGKWLRSEYPAERWHVMIKGDEDIAVTWRKNREIGGTAPTGAEIYHQEDFDCGCPRLDLWSEFLQVAENVDGLTLEEVAKRLLGLE